VRVLIAVVVWVAALAGAAELSTVVADHVHREQATASFDASSLGASDARSLFRTANFARALAAVRKHFGSEARFNDFVVYPGYLSATVVTSPSTSTDVYVSAVGRYNATDGGTPGGMPTFSITRIAPDAPAVLAHRIAIKGGTPLSQLHYMVAEQELIENRFRWLVYPVTGNRVEYYFASTPASRLFEYLNGSSSGPQPVGR
jgi:hypothetical protein